MNNNALIKWGWLRAIVGLVVMYPIVDNSIYVLELIRQLIDFSPNRLCITANNLIFTILAVFLVRKLIDRKSFVSLGFSIKGHLKDILYGFFGAMILMGTGFLILLMLGNLRITSFSIDMSALLYWGLTLLLAAALEEVSFRGYMLNNMMASMNNILAAGIIAILFGIGHGMGQNASVIGIINCALMGLFVGLYYVRKKNLWMPIFFHLGWNFFQGTIFGFNVSGRSFNYSLLGTDLSGSELLTGGEVGFEGSLIVTLLTILAIIFFEIRFRGHRIQKEGDTVK
jgi:hypothetical protein